MNLSLRSCRKCAPLLRRGFFALMLLPLPLLLDMVASGVMRLPGLDFGSRQMSRHGMGRVISLVGVYVTGQNWTVQALYGTAQCSITQADGRQ